MKLLSALILINLLSSVSFAEDHHVIELQKLELNAVKYFPGGVDPLLTQNPNLPSRTLGYKFEIHIDTTLLSYLYWNSRVFSSTDQVINPDESTSGGQFRDVGLEFHLGVNITENLRFGYRHLSQHVLDANYGNAFPREDGLEINLILFNNPNKPNSLF